MAFPKVDDRVTIRETSIFYHRNDPHNPSHVVGTVVRHDGADCCPWEVVWDNGCRNYYDAEDLSKVEG